MRRIASARDLQTELRRLLAYSEGVHPSREVVAAELRSLADRVAASPRDEVVSLMTKFMEEGIKKIGKDEFKEVLEAAKYGVFRPDGGDKERLTKIKQIQNSLVHSVWRIAGLAKQGKETDPPISKEAAEWFYKQTDAVQYTMARQLLEQEAKKLGIKLDKNKLIK